ncbi:hypothetical protein [Salipiger mucosus]|uniref:Capsular polysaccharide export system inner membrane protein KpsE n=1 Tax=Salipiger mucosus DSM 16094 TaxID=1123237 RepID=S9RIP2_9RHOB|nr:hypothetical protein [Salipiger mucosus]EPX77985.1 Capsular polysaccharide export system inner membrane protein KpsE [Salipiger mucosus DSM 16094]
MDLSRTLSKIRMQHAILLVPALIAAVYLFILAGDRFVSESRFTIKSQGEASAATNLDLGILGGTSAAKQDQLIVRDYMMSRDMMEKTFNEFGTDALSGPFQDILWYITDDSPVKAKLSHYRSMVEFTFDEEAAVSTVETNAFSPETARKLNRFLLTEAENYINAFTERSSETMIDYSRRDLEAAQDRVMRITDEIRNAQRTAKTVDPETDLGVVATTLTELETKLAAAKSELDSLQSYLQDDTHQVIAQRRKISNLESQISNLRDRMAGADDDSLADTSVQFSTLKSRLQFANENYVSARKTLEMAKVQAMQSRKHLVIIDHPDLADFSTYPRRLISFLFALCVIGAVGALTRMTLVLIKDY